MTDSLTATATAHAVTLNWTQSTTSGLTGNNVYRGTANGGPYTLLASLGVVTTYSDSTVVPGNTYYYVVTALEGTFESPNSNQVSAVVPATPNAPTGLTATVS